MDTGCRKWEALLACDTLLFTKKETEFSDCARDLPGSLLPVSRLDMPQQPAFLALNLRVPLPQWLSPGCLPQGVTTALALTPA